MQPDRIGGGPGNPQSFNRYAYSLNDPINVADSAGLYPRSLFGESYFLDAYLSNWGLYIDGFAILPGQERLFWGLLTSGAAAVAPFGATVYLGSGGKTYRTETRYRSFSNVYPPDADTVRIGVTDVAYQVQIEVKDSIFFLPNDGALYSPGKWNPMIVEIIRGFVNNSECVNAFKLVGIDLADLIKKGITVGPADALKKLSAAALGLTPSAQTAMRDAFFQERLFSKRQAISTVGIAGTTSGRPHIFLGFDAFTELKEVLAHELIHSGGYRKKGSGSNDLSYMGIGYDNIINTCAK
jgi:hypothetical protein